MRQIPVIDLSAARIGGLASRQAVALHRQNIERYCRLLATELTDLERQYLHKRIAEEHAQLERLRKEEQQAKLRLIKGSTGEYCDVMGAGE